jgi:hypothetical protein
MPSSCSAASATLGSSARGSKATLAAVDGALLRLWSGPEGAEQFRRLATFRRKKPFLDDRATDLGARTRRQIAAGKV